MNDRAMIKFEEAIRIVTDSAFITGTEEIDFISSMGRVIAENILSDIDIPPFNRAAVDGYACRKDDLTSDLEVAGVISAGTEPLPPPGKDQCFKIMTGGVVPEKCDMVFMVEDAEVLPSGKVRFRGFSLKNNISLRGEDIKAGTTVLQAGKIIEPQDIAVMASAGCSRVKVRKKPKLAVISSGNELVEPSRIPAPGQIRDSNSYQLMAQAERAGASPGFYGIARDDENETFQLISRAISENEIVVITGGVSMGDYDFVPSVMERAGVTILFTKIAVQPGKPTTFGLHPEALVFGLPGNPVSSFIQFEVLVRPLIEVMTGSITRQKELIMRMGSDYSRRTADRMGWHPVSIDPDGYAIPVEYHGSAHIASLSGADGIMRIPEGIYRIEKGGLVNVRRI